jgi:hypothetical protein
VAKPSVDYILVWRLRFSRPRVKMVWLLAFITIVALASGFLHFYKRHLDVLTGPWISGANPNDSEPAATTTQP